MAVGPDRAHLLIDSVADVCGHWRNGFAALGFVVAAGFGIRFLYRATRGISEHFFGRFGTEKRLKEFGEWAVVTGCTRGIGREFACQFASMGLNIVLMARNNEALTQLADEIEKKYNVSTVRVTADFNSGHQIYSDIQDLLDTKDIGILVNNVGVMYDYPQYFHLVEEEKLNELINVNISASQMLTHYVLRECFIPKRRGLVVFMSSGACFRPTPQMSAYAATKLYLLYLAKCLNSEMKYLGYHRVKIQALTPMYVATAMTGYSSWVNDPNFFLSPDPETYVRHAIGTLGRRDESAGYWAHSFQKRMADFVPEGVWTFIANRLQSYFRSSNAKRS